MTTASAPASAVLQSFGSSVVSEIEFEEHESILGSLTQVKTTDLGEVSINTGFNLAGAFIVLMNTMAGRYAVLTAISPS